MFRLYIGQRLITPIWVGFGSFSSLSLDCFALLPDLGSSESSWSEGCKHMMTERRMSFLVSTVRYSFARLWVYGLTKEKSELAEETGFDEILKRKSKYRSMALCFP